MTDSLFDLTGRVALVTGASRGIGEAIARRLADHGAHVIIASRKIGPCEEVAASIRDNGGKASALTCHIGETASIAAAFGEIAQTHGRLDILVNNAAANPYFGPILDTPESAIDKTIDVNIKGYFLASQMAGRMMRAQKNGVIINVASINALTPAPMQAVYSISKAAVVSMTKAFAKECAAFGIRVNAILPGLTKTDFAGALFEHEGIYKQIISMIPQGRHAVPDELSGAALFLASDAASFTTGTTLVVDGGMTA
ncbi:SDR family oxidoreductase [Shimia aestuarii]|nr:SDR family oxidoreductase [Shimia aestuarii]